MAGWVTDSFLAEGKTELPDGAYKLQHDYTGSSSAPDPEEVEAMFPDQESFQNFLAGEDYSYGLADVTDAEFDEHHETIVSAMKGLGLDGLMVALTTVPHTFLQEVPLVDGQWIDRHMLELAEWGARLARQGFVVEESNDPHPLAWFQIVHLEHGEEASPGVTSKLWQQEKRYLDRFGVVPEYRAGVHLGEVMTAEIGDLKKGLGLQRRRAQHRRPDSRRVYPAGTASRFVGRPLPPLGSS